MFNISVHDWDNNYYVPHNLGICTICRLIASHGHKSCKLRAVCIVVSLLIYIQVHT